MRSDRHGRGGTEGMVFKGLNLDPSQKSLWIERDVNGAERRATAGVLAAWQFLVAENLPFQKGNGASVVNHTVCTFF